MRREMPSASLFLHVEACNALANALEHGAVRQEPPQSLASSLHMRELRVEVIGSMLRALKPYDGDGLRVVTVINAQWCLSPQQLQYVTAAAIKAQFRSHLKRGGVFDHPGFTIGFLHGEFEPSGSRWQLHFHLVTTAVRADALVEGLKGRWGYTKTATGAAPIKRQKLNNRPVQLSYLFKSYWPERPLIVIDGVGKRVRVPRRIGEPFHSQYLVWLDAQQLTDIMVVSGGDYRGGYFHFRR